MAPILRRFARHAWRGIVLVVGLVLIAAGLVMMVTPGPGIAAILGGLALLSTEFAWAKRVLDWVRRRFAAARAEVRRRTARRSRGPAPEGGTEGVGAGGPRAAGAEVRSTGGAPTGGAPAGGAPAGSATRPRDGRDPQSTTS
jgi:Putative transmembrane protein (PGPGW)